MRYEGQTAASDILVCKALVDSVALCGSVQDSSAEEVFLDRKMCQTDSMMPLHTAGGVFERWVDFDQTG